MGMQASTCMFIIERMGICEIAREPLVVVRNFLFSRVEGCSDM